MRLWLISQTKNNDYDTYDSAVVAAETVRDARMVHPWGYFWDVPKGDPAETYEGLTPKNWSIADWTFPKYVNVEYIGETDRDLPNGTVILASFNAG